MIKRPEPIAVVKSRRNRALAAITKQMPYIDFLGVDFHRAGRALRLETRLHCPWHGDPESIDV